MITLPPSQAPQDYDHYAREAYEGGTRVGNTVYPASSGLSLEGFPRYGRMILGGICAAALVIGGIGAYRSYDSVVNRAVYDAQDVQTQLDRGATVDVPVLASYAGEDSATIQQQLTDAGYTVVDVAQLTGSTSRAIDIAKLPGDMSTADAALALARGVDNLSPADAAKLLSGSWRMTQTNATGVNLIVRYADFTSGTVDGALSAAIASQGWSEASASDPQTDSNDNTYRTGAVEAGGATYTWTVSACPLSEVYAFSGEPDDAYYVGIHLEQ